MIPYYIFFIISFCFILFDRTSISIENKIKLYLFYITICIIFFGGRYECDLDYEQYTFIYENTPIIGEKNYFIKSAILEVEYGFIFCCSLLKTLSLPSQSIFFLCSIITFIFISKAIWKVSVNPFLCLFLYVTHFFNLPFTQIRFGIAMALVLYACTFLNQNNYRKYLIFTFIALSFHTSALAGFIPLFIKRIQLTKRKTYLILLLALALLVVPIDYIIHSIVRQIGIYRYIAYLSDTSNKMGMFVLMLVTSFPFIYYKKFFASKIKNYYIILFMILGSFLLLPLGEVALTFARFSTLLFVSTIILISNYLIVFKKNKLNYFAFYAMIFLYSFTRYKHNLSFMEDYNFFFSTFF